MLNIFEYLIHYLSALFPYRNGAARYAAGFIISAAAAVAALVAVVGPFVVLTAPPVKVSGESKNGCSWDNGGAGTGETLKDELEAWERGDSADIAAAIAAAEGWEELELPLPDNVTVLSASISMPIFRK